MKKDALIRWQQFYLNEPKLKSEQFVGVKLTTFYFVRHAHVEWIPDEDRPLSAIGLKDARRVANILFHVIDTTSALCFRWGWWIRTSRSAMKSRLSGAKRTAVRRKLPSSVTGNSISGQLSAPHLIPKPSAKNMRKVGEHPWSRE